jgi:hypothetical protein
MLRTSYGRVALLLSGLLVCPGVVTGQLISLKTVPVAAGDQFLIFPSENLAMGGVSIALDDRLLDPYLNPARGAHVRESQVFSTPTFYSVSNSAGSAWTLPVGTAFQSRGWFGGIFAALQNLKRGEELFAPVPFGFPGAEALSSRSATNKYANILFGKTLESELSIGFSAFLAELGGLDGTEHLFATASGIEQRGDIVDLRMGLSKEFPGDRTLEAVVLHNRFSMTHDVMFFDWFVVDTLNWIWEPQMRVEVNQDHSRTWGAHVAYDQPVGPDGWRVGGLFTANRKDHPKIPNYEIMNIPKDPGHSNAFNVGLGVAKVTERTRFGFDFVFEPATSETWAEAEGPIPTIGGDTIPDGKKTVENSFEFSNAFVNMGVTHDAGPVALQLGLRVSAYDFHLDQWNHVLESSRRQDEDWMEWVPSWGVSVRLADLELRYAGRVTTGTGRPGVALTAVAEGRALDAAAANDVLLAPSGPLTLQDATVMTHQLSVLIPIR